MSTKTDDRLDEMPDRIDGLEARAQADGGQAHPSIEGQMAALRQHEAAARAAAREALEARTREFTAHAEVAEAGLSRAELQREVDDAMNELE